MTAIEPLVTTTWLENQLANPDVRVVDMRGYVTTRPIAPGAEVAAYQGAKQEYDAEHIPGSVYVDWTRDIIDPDDPVSVQIAPPDRFAEAMGRCGIDENTHVVAVDHRGGQFATRLWWALQYYGHERVSVLDGGFHRWVVESRPLDRNPVTVSRRTFVPRPRADWRITAEALTERLPSAGVEFQLLDARDAEQFTGRRRRGLRGGHIPGARNVPRELFFRDAPEAGFRPLPEIAADLERLGVDPARPTVAYCNGGVAATVVLFNLFRLGGRQLTNYDGSWNEWGERIELPAETSDSSEATGRT